MEIHSSSLSFIPHKAGAKKKNDHLQLLPKEDHLTDTVSNTDASQALAKNTTHVKVAKVNRLSNDIDSLKSLGKNIHSNRALNAYIQEKTQPLKNQRAELVSSVDFYV